MSLSILNSIGQTVFELESGNENVDKQTDGQINGQTNIQNFTNFERNLAMKVIYLPVKFEFDWTNLFELESGNKKCGRTDGRADGHRTHQSNRRVGYTQPA